MREVADEIGATPAQVALAWIRSRSAAAHPILGASSAEQLADNLGVLDTTLSGEQAQRLEAGADFTPGFPGDFLAQVHPGVFGAAVSGLDRGARR
ncbi:aldo/keto reductase [Streptomyces candidus]|uniref:Aryl-alcohol dehydrogenase-like predicted oxidoreductase n=1 Tax=Streptomyces candidus TaxID=67283 RepID=A0A7X0LPZ4_9ACTN|nr:aldo/keto reductase [Streptomyces candidus]MBB6435974.1 aryl-alcohol dehydrogenase-like predicted oxidoreductase [Streptomyces candidus]GHH43195.1 hypothetical protein GCM10018773_28790 [Streptomyces candidus]